MIASSVPGEERVSALRKRDIDCAFAKDEGEWDDSADEGREETAQQFTTHLFDGARDVIHDERSFRLGMPDDTSEYSLETRGEEYQMRIKGIRF